MTDLKFPVCPICKQEVLLPFSIVQVAGTISEKTFGNWICSNCGFFLSTKGNRANNPELDIKAGFSKNLIKKVEELRKKYYEKQSEKPI